jgi:phage gp45-like
MSWRTAEDHAYATGGTMRLLLGMLRRMVVTLSSDTLWQLVGQRGGPGGAGDEVITAETFPGIGIYARAPSSGSPEAVVAALGGTKASVVVATRDEATRQVGAGDLAEGETCVYNDQARVIVRADGTVEIRLHSGVAVPLATKADLAAVVTAFNAHTHVYTPGPGTAIPTAVPVPTAPSPTGTSVLKAQ